MVVQRRSSDTFVLYATGITLTGRDFVVTCEPFTKTRRRPTTRSNVENVKKRFRQLVLWARTVLSVFVFSNAPNAPMRIVRGSSEIDTKRLVATLPQRRAGSLVAAATAPATITTATTNKSRRRRRRRQRRVEEQEEEQEEEEEATATTVTTVLTVVLSTCGSAADVVVVSSDPDHRPKNRPDRHRNGVSK